MKIIYIIILFFCISPMCICNNYDSSVIKRQIEIGSKFIDIYSKNLVYAKYMKFYIDSNKVEKNYNFDKYVLMLHKQSTTASISSVYNVFKNCFVILEANQPVLFFGGEFTFAVDTMYRVYFLKGFGTCHLSNLLRNLSIPIDDDSTAFDLAKLYLFACDEKGKQYYEIMNDSTEIAKLKIPDVFLPRIERVGDEYQVRFCFKGTEENDNAFIEYFIKEYSFNINVATKNITTRMKYITTVIKE